MPKRNDTDGGPDARREQPTSHPPSAPPQEEELSAYELLERRSHELAEDRAHGGFGTPQPPNAAVPLLYPKPRVEPRPDERAAEEPAKKRGQPRQVKKKK